MSTPLRALLARAGEALFWLAAGLPLLVALCLLATLLSLAPARAEEAACGGRDLMADIAARDPKALAEIERAERQTPNGDALFWRIEKPGLRPSFLLGTMHLSDPRVLVLPAPAEAARHRADLLVAESEEILDETRMAATVMAHPEVTMLPAGQKIDGLLDPEEYRRLRAILESRGMPLPLLSQMQPWMIMSAVATPVCELQRKAAGATFLDRRLALEAAAAGKPVKGLETLLEQAQSMAGVPPRLQAQALMETLTLSDRLPDMMETMIRLYVAQRVGAIEPMLKAINPDGDAAGAAEFDERIVKARNRRMAERLIPMLGEGNVFVAVGALHLPGAEGLVEKLRAAGFTVTAER